MQGDNPAVAAEAASSTSPRRSTHRSRNQQQREQTHTLLQVSTSGALYAGLYQGVVSTRTTLLHGDLGVGAFALLDGEMTRAWPRSFSRLCSYFWGISACFSARVLCGSPIL